MSLIIAFVFLAVFIAVLLLYFGFQAEPDARRKTITARLAAIPPDAGSRDQNDVMDAIVRDDARSSVPWVDRILRRTDALARVQALLQQADSPWTVARLLAYTLLGGLAGLLAAYWRTGAMLPSAVLGGAAACLPMLYIWRLRASRLGKFEQRLPEALDMMVSAIRAGHGLLAAIGTVAKETPAPISVEFRKCFDEQNFGLDFRTAMENLARRVPLHDVQIVVTAMLIQKESGGNLAEIIEKVAHIIRERFRLKRQVRVHTAQGRLTGWILALLPVILGFGIFLVNPEYMQALWQNPTGVKLMYTASIMTLIGGLIIRKIVKIRI